VECISTGDCFNNLICNQTTHTCVSSIDGGVPVDAGSDASAPDASIPDAGHVTTDAGQPAIDGSFADASGEDGGLADNGTIGGAACSCRAAGGGANDGRAAILGVMIAAGVVVARRRRRA
jgi:MYXO-CTERM domain-containing protein